MTGPNDSEMNGLSQQPPSLVYCCPWFALLAYLFFFNFFFLLIIKIFLTSGTRDRAGVSASLEAHHWKLAWVSTICHETKQASLSNLYNINNSMPHFYTCAGGPQYCRGFWGGGGLTVFRHLRLSNCVFNSPCAVQEAAWNLGKRDGAPRREIHRY